ncbi:hypothetical protein PXD04_01110 [Methanosphaera sp. ISO3-F5]|uniref:hypothetical protein n=1 Tax=Methanosphaera sp. ISO3-F5 TaxID=1452353 RepID=UPI002B25D044|nr:hypothetical protein [Methanosphaera sp. ISO3-F5]WQH64425.1 hypothetical protein PXD04_01110 [Methanosphaera sp. ISO3-F5]
MQKKSIKTIFLFLMLIMVMVGITTVSATNNNHSTKISTHETITHDTVHITDQSTNNIKQETKTIKNDEENKISTTNKTIKKYKKPTKSANETDIPVGPAKKDANLGIYSEPSVVRIDETSSFTFRLSDENNEPLTQQEVIFKFNNEIGTTTEETYQAGLYTSSYVFNALGTNNISVTFTGNDEYTPLTYNFSVNVRKTSFPGYVSISNGKIELGESVNLSGQVYVDDSTYEDKTVTFNFNNNNYTTKITDNCFSYELTPEEPGEYLITTTIDETEKYDNYRAEISFKVVKGKIVEIYLKADEYVNITEQAYLSGFLYDREHNRIPNQKLVIRYDEEEHVINSDDNGDFLFNLTSDDVKSAWISVVYEGTEEYAPVDASVWVNFVEQTDTSIITIDNITSVYGDKITYGNFIRIEGTLKDSEGNPIQYVSLNNGQGFTDEEGHYSFSMPVNDVGLVNVTVFFNGNDKFKKSNATQTIMVICPTRVIVDPISDVEVGETVHITGKLCDVQDTPVKNAGVNIHVNGENFSAVTNDEGVFSLEYITVFAGYNAVYVVYDGDDIYTGTISDQTGFNVSDSRKEVSLGINYIGTQTMGDSINVTGSLYSINYDEEGEYYYNLGLDNVPVIIKFDGSNYTVTTDEYGNFVQELHLEKVGISKVNIIYEGNETYQATTTYSVFEVIKEKVTNLHIKYDNYVNVGDSAIITGYLYDKDNNKIPNQKLLITYSDATYEVTSDDNGDFIFEFNDTSEVKSCGVLV